MPARARGALAVLAAAIAAACCACSALCAFGEPDPARKAQICEDVYLRGAVGTKTIVVTAFLNYEGSFVPPAQAAASSDKTGRAFIDAEFLRLTAADAFKRHGFTVLTEREAPNLPKYHVAVDLRYPEKGDQPYLFKLVLTLSRRYDAGNGAVGMRRLWTDVEMDSGTMGDPRAILTLLHSKTSEFVSQFSPDTLPLPPETRNTR